jgi:MFS family permease
VPADIRSRGVGGGREDAAVVSMGAFWRQLSTEGRWLLSTVAFTTLGRGLTLPFTVIYLHEVRGFSLDLSGTLMALIAVVAFAVTGPSGVLTDRFGARAVLLAGLVSMMVGNVVLAFATTPAVAVVGLVLIGINFGASWPALNALIASVVTGQIRQQYFGINFMLVNLGIGVGGVIGGLVTDVGEPATFTAIFLGDAATALIPIVLLLVPLRHVRTHGHHDDGATPSVGYLQIVQQPAVRWLTGLTFLAIFVGYGQFEAGLPAFARQVSQVSTEVVGVAFAVNTVVIVALQALVLTRIAGHRRTRVMLVMSASWILAWLLLASTGLVPDSVGAAVGILAFMAVFAFGETLMQPTIPAICNDLADDRNRGRYNAVNSAAFQGGAIAGPVVAGWLLHHGWSTAYVGLMVLGCVALAGMALALERRVPAEANGLTEAADEAALPT